MIFHREPLLEYQLTAFFLVYEESIYCKLKFPKHLINFLMYFVDLILKELQFSIRYFKDPILQKNDSLNDPDN